MAGGPPPPPLPAAGTHPAAGTQAPTNRPSFPSPGVIRPGAGHGGIVNGAPPNTCNPVSSPPSLLQG